MGRFQGLSRGIKKDFSNLEDAFNSDVYVTLPKLMHCEPIFGYGKLWMVSHETLPDAQNLYNVDVVTKSISFNVIPTKPQITKSFLADGLNGFIYVTRFNMSGVSKHASSTGAQTDFIITNARPTAIWTNQSGKILVAGFEGMIDELDRTTNVVVHAYGALVQVGSLIDTEDGYIWTTNLTKSGMLRLNKSSLKVIYSEDYWPDEDPISVTALLDLTSTTLKEGDPYTGADPTFGQSGEEPAIATVTASAQAAKHKPDPDFKFEDIGAYKNLKFIRGYPMQYWNGSAMVSGTFGARILFNSGSDLKVFRIANGIYRKPLAKLEAYGYITTGEYDYSGDCDGGDHKSVGSHC